MYRLGRMRDLLLATLLPKRALPDMWGLTRHLQAEEHLLLVLIGFAGSVIITRFFLEWSGYPQIATAELHIAHVLWGGLLLFSAALLLLIWRGRTIARLGSVLSGIGFGLFIDEVGKFITQNNDYFYPLAAPIIYAFFLLTVLVYLGIRRSRPGEGQSDLQRVVALLEAGVDPRLSRAQYQAVRAELEVVARTASTASAQLAHQVTVFLDAEEWHRDKHEHPGVGNWTPLAERINQWLTACRLRRGLTLGFALLALRGLVSGLAAFVFMISIADIERWQQLSIPATPLSSGGPFTTLHLFSVSVTLALEGLVGALSAGAAALLLLGRTRRGLELGYWGLLLSLTVVRFFALYFNQFDVILTTLLQLALLLGVLHYRSHYLGTGKT